VTAPVKARYPGRGLHGEIVQTIGQRIVSGVYPPGHLLYAEDLERELGVSKTVVREAVKVLAAKGLVNSRPKRGTIVQPRSEWSLLDADLLTWRGRGQFDMGFLQDLTEVRLIVEPEGARLAAERRSEADLDEMQAAIGVMSVAGVVGPAVIEADLAFHRALLGAAHNELLSQMESVIEAGLRVRDQFVHGNGQVPDSVPDHQAILDAVRAGNGLAAADATRSLLQRSAVDVVRLLDGSLVDGGSGDGAPAPR
jgi:DNA-binding FadR family transcriptional regulator